jgi:uncharacterized protein VirK/YbjX
MCINCFNKLPQAIDHARFNDLQSTLRRSFRKRVHVLSHDRALASRIASP